MLKDTNLESFERVPQELKNENTNYIVKNINL